MDTNNSESISPSKYRKLPLCPWGCCGGREKRKGYTCTKAASRRQSNKARRSKPKYKSHRK